MTKKGVKIEWIRHVTIAEEYRDDGLLRWRDTRAMHLDMSKDILIDDSGVGVVHERNYTTENINLFEMQIYKFDQFGDGRFHSGLAPAL